MIVVPLWVGLIIMALALVIWLTEIGVKAGSWLKTGRHEPKKARHRDHTKSSDVWKRMDR